MNVTLSPRKLAANRDNAQHSTGPKTAAGKLNASRNSIKHGLLTSRLVFDNQDEEAKFSHLLEQIARSAGAQGGVKRLMVEEIATCYWRLAEVERLLQREMHAGNPGHCQTALETIARQYKPLQWSRRARWKARHLRRLASGQRLNLPNEAKKPFVCNSRVASDGTTNQSYREPGFSFSSFCATELSALADSRSLYFCSLPPVSSPVAGSPSPRRIRPKPHRGSGGLPRRASLTRDAKRSALAGESLLLEILAP